MIKKILDFLFVLAILLLAPATSYGRERLFGYCEDGGQKVVTVGQISATSVQQSYPNCTVTVYYAGTTNVAPIYSDNSGSIKLNPFTAANDGFWFFYANDGTYDVKFSGGGIPTPFTRGGQLANDPAASGVFNITAYGALCNGVADDQAAIDAAAAAIVSHGGGVLWIPYTGSSCPHSNVITLSSNTFVDGPGTLQATNFNLTAIKFLNASNSGIKNINIYNPAPSRLVSTDTVAVLFDNCTNCFGMNVRIDGSATTGFYTTNGSSNVRITANDIRNTKADSIHFTGGSYNVVAVGNTMRNSGDDCVAFVSYLSDGAPVTGGVASGNDCRDGSARAFTSIGSLNINIVGNVGINLHAHGIVCAYEISFSTYTPDGCNIVGNTIVNADADRTTNFNSITIVKASRANIVGNIIRDGPGIAITGSSGDDSTHVNIASNILYNIVLKAAIGSSVVTTSNLTITGNTVELATLQCVLLSLVEETTVSDNHCENTMTIGSGTFGVIDVAGSTNVYGSGNRVGTYGTAFGELRVAGSTNVQIFMASPDDPPEDEILFGITGDNRVYDSSPLFRWDHNNDALLLGSGAVFVSDNLITLTGGGLIITTDHDISGSGGASRINLFSGQFIATSASSHIIDFNTGDVGALFQVKVNGVLSISVNADGVLSLKEFSFGELASIAGENHMVYCVDCEANDPTMDDYSCVGSGAGTLAVGTGVGWRCLP